MHRVALISVLAMSLTAGCGSQTRPRADENAAVLEVMEAARSALLAGDADAACGLLTPHARERVLGFQVDFLPEGTPVPSDRPGVPQTCEEMVRELWDQEHGPDATPAWSRDLEAAEFTVRALGDDRARARLKVPVAYGPVVEFSLRKEGSEWRIDDSDAVPSGF